MCVVLMPAATTFYHYDCEEMCPTAVFDYSSLVWGMLCSVQL